MPTIDIEKIKPILQDAGVEYAGLFGSFARGEAGPESDVDILVRLGRPMGLFAFYGLEDTLAQILGRKVDLVTERALKPLVREGVYRDLKTIYGTAR